MSASGVLLPAEEISPSLVWIPNSVFLRPLSLEMISSALPRFGPFVTRQRPKHQSEGKNLRVCLASSSRNKENPPFTFVPEFLFDVG